MSSYFKGAAVKVLSEVEANPMSSNQHEIGINASMKRFLGEENQKLEISHFYFPTEGDSVRADGSGTLYDSRAQNPNRAAEWRLYYESNPVTSAMRPEDHLLLAQHVNGKLYFIVIQGDHGLALAMLRLFGFSPELPFRRFLVSSTLEDGGGAVGYLERLLLEEIGLPQESSASIDADELADRFGSKYPTTAIFSEFARTHCPGVDPVSSPDDALLSWLQMEEDLFRALEGAIEGDRISKGFILPSGSADVDGFVKYSLSVQNRRKSRRGHSFEHHLASIFSAHKLSFDRQATTENGNRPDFLFPGSLAYNNALFPSTKLAMVAAKSTCKDRWRQILVEANRIPVKYLTTLDFNLSKNQLGQMKSRGVIPVIPRSEHTALSGDQDVTSLSQMLENLADLQL
jgi:hypothetical protein